MALMLNLQYHVLLPPNNLCVIHYTLYLSRMPLQHVASSPAHSIVSHVHMCTEEKVASPNQQAGSGVFWAMMNIIFDDLDKKNKDVGTIC